MGAAIARGLVALAPAHRSTFHANPSAGKPRRWQRLGINTFTSNDELLAQDPDAVVLAVMQVLPGVLAEHTEDLPAAW